MIELTAARRLLRRTIPFSARWRIRALRRRFVDSCSCVRFADGLGDAGGFSHRICEYERPLICYAGQEQRFTAKKHNVELALSSLDGLMVAPGETFSFWQSVERPTVRSGFARAAALKDGVLVDDVGGAICLASTLLYNVGLLSGMAIDERWCHSVDSYGDARYFELGRDAAVEYAYRDLRLRNIFDVPLLLRTSVTDDAVRAEAWSPSEMDLRVEIAVTVAQREGREIRVSTSRKVSGSAGARVDDPGASVYRISSGR